MAEVTHAYRDSYTKTAKMLHWVMAFGIIGMLGLGLYMDRLGFTPLKFQLIQLHKSIGITLLMLVVVRLLWRFTNPAPMLPAHMPLWQKAAAHLTHTALYGLMLAMPLSGWLMSDAAGYHPSWFGIDVPILMQSNPEWAKLLGQAHGIGANLFYILLTAHVGAAFFHHFFVRDDTLRRMLPKLLARRLP